MSDHARHKAGWMAFDFFVDWLCAWISGHPAKHHKRHHHH